MTTKFLTHKRTKRKERKREKRCACEFVFFSQRCERLLGAATADSSSIIIIFAQKSARLLLKNKEEVKTTHAHSLSLSLARSYKTIRK